MHNPPINQVTSFTLAPAARVTCALLVLFLFCAAWQTGCATKGGWLEWRATTIRSDGQRTEERLSVAQPDNPAREATFERKADGAAKVELPPAYKPADPPTPASRALGWLIWIGGVACLIGCVIIVMRLTGWGVLAAAPKGVGYGLAAGGGLLIAVAVAFDSNPLWAVAAAGVGILIAVIVGFGDNLKQLMAKVAFGSKDEMTVTDGGVVHGGHGDDDGDALGFFGFSGSKP